MGKGNGSTRTAISSNPKVMQLAIINASNPMIDDYHTGIRSVEDINTWKEAVETARREGQQGGWEELSSYPDVTNEMAENALKTGEITIYSSYPIKDGVFVTPSRMMAEEYAGGGVIYSRKVKTSDVAWINTDEGQLAIISKKKK